MGKETFDSALNLKYFVQVVKLLWPTQKLWLLNFVISLWPLRNLAWFPEGLYGSLWERLHYNVQVLPWPHWKCLHFVVVVGLERPRDPKSYAGGSMLLVGSPLPHRSKVMAQTKRGTLVLQAGGWAAGWRPTPVKMLVTKTQLLESAKTLHGL